MPTSYKIERTNTYLTNSDWIVPYGVTSVTFECWGGGGSGSQSDGSGGGGGGGGGGAYAKKILNNIKSGDSYKIKVGSGGRDSNGTSSYILGPGETLESESVCCAKGGYGGSLVSTGGTCISGSIGDVVFSGGTGGDGTRYEMESDYGGGGGEGAGIHSNGNNASNRIGGTGGDGGNGGNGYLTTPTTQAEDGYEYGGGGGGGVGTPSGDGGNGKVVVSFDIIENEILCIIF